jgi:hypothetical protein
MSSGRMSRRVDSSWPNLTKIGSEVFQRLAQPHRAGGGEVAPEHQALRGEQQARAQAGLDLVLQHQAVEPVAIGDAGDAKEAEDAHGEPELTGNGQYNSGFIGNARNAPQRLRESP